MNFCRCIFIFFILLLISPAAAQQKFEPTLESLNQAISGGQGKEYMAEMEALGDKEASKERWVAAATAYYWASHMAWSTGQLQKNITDASKALEFAQKGKNPVWEAASMMWLATAYGDLGQPEKALDFLNRALEIATNIRGDKQALEGHLYIRLGEYYSRQGDQTQAIKYLTVALTIFEAREAALKNPSQPNARRSTELVILRILQRLGLAYSRAGNLSDAIKTLERAELMAASGVTRAIDVGIMSSLGSAYAAQKNYPRALEYLTKALTIAEARQQYSAIRTSSTAIAQILLQTGKPAEAIPYYKKTIEVIESTRSLLQSEELRASFFENKRYAYAGIISANLRAKDDEEAFNYNERARSRAFLDILGSKVQLGRQSALVEKENALQSKIAELRARVGNRGESDEDDIGEGAVDRIAQGKELAATEKAYAEFLTKVRKENKEQASLMNVEPLTLKQVQELLDPDVTMLEYFVANNAVWLWVVERDRLQFVSTSVARTDLVSKVTELRNAIYQLENQGKFMALSQELYKLLIEPALPHIKEKELIIVPHDVLHYLPFQALIASDGHYLIEKYPINYLSSASLLQFTKEKRKAMGDKVLALGNPDLGDPKMSLYYAEIEAKEIKSLYPQAAVYVEKEATEDKAKTLSPQNDIIHFATHAQLNENDPLSSAILLTKSDKEDGRLEVKEIFGMDLHANLVVLSACETGLGKISSGDELVGLTRAFIYAGTPSVVASLWSVDDGSTAALMARFYKNLKTMSKVEALRQAQLELMRGGISSDLPTRPGIGGVGKLGETPSSALPTPSSLSVSTSQPYFWAPFILVGDSK